MLIWKHLNWSAAQNINASGLKQAKNNFNTGQSNCNRVEHICVFSNSQLTQVNL